MPGFAFTATFWGGLIELDQQHTYVEKEAIPSEGEGCVAKEIVIKKLEQMFRNLEAVKQ
jgi:hypothetical protein